jgi:hypothetical protein
VDAEQDKSDLQVLAAVGRMYLDAIDADPENEYLTLPAAIRVTQVRDAVECQERVASESSPRTIGSAALVSVDFDRRGQAFTTVRDRDTGNEYVIPGGFAEVIEWREGPL